VPVESPPLRIDDEPSGVLPDRFDTDQRAFKRVRACFQGTDVWNSRTVAQASRQWVRSDSHWFLPRATLTRGGRDSRGGWERGASV